MKTYNKYDEQSDDEDSELFSEIKALENMKKEKANISETEKVYHSEGLCRAYSELENINLSFLETMEVCEFSMDIPDENNDIEREVRT